MSIKSGKLEFIKYINDILKKLYDSETMYEGNIKEERINGEIQTFTIRLDKINNQMKGELNE